MNQLTYGWNKDDISAYPVKPLVLADKLGGPYISCYIRDQLKYRDEKMKERIQFEEILR